jgi:hypothetical protein
MMKSAENRLSGELAEPLDWPMARRILVQGQVGAASVVIRGVGSENAAQAPFTEDHDVIEAFAAD